MARVEDAWMRLGLFVQVIAILLLVVARDSESRGPAGSRRIGGRDHVPGGRNLLGGWRRLNVSDPEVRSVAEHGVTTLETSTNSLDRYKLLKIVLAKSQVVSGMKYHLNVQIGHTTCTRDQDIELSRCEVKKEQNCTLEIWTQKWLNRTELTSYTCDQFKFAKLHTSRRMMPGGIAPANLNEVAVINATRFAITELETKTNGDYKVSLRRTVEVTKQVVSGMLYRILVEIHLVSVLDNDQQAHATCLVEVWEQAWMTPRYRMRKHDCDTKLIPTGELPQ